MYYHVTDKGVTLLHKSPRHFEEQATMFILRSPIYFIPLFDYTTLWYDLYSLRALYVCTKVGKILLQVFPKYGKKSDTTSSFPKYGKKTSDCRKVDHRLQEFTTFTLASLLCPPVLWCASSFSYWCHHGVKGPAYRHLAAYQETLYPYHDPLPPPQALVHYNMYTNYTSNNK